jgi:hypothetical protein
LVPFFIDDAQHRSERAANARRVASELTDPEQSRKMLDVADAYDRMAARAAARAEQEGGQSNAPYDQA